MYRLQLACMTRAAYASRLNLFLVNAPLINACILTIPCFNFRYLLRAIIVRNHRWSESASICYFILIQTHQYDALFACEDDHPESVFQHLA